MSTVTTIAPAGTYAADLTHSKLGFAAKHMGIATVRGEFRDFDASLEVREDGTAVARGSARVTSITTNEDQRDEHLRSDDFFAAEQYPEMTFESTSIERVDEDTFKVVGDLTIRGVTKPVELTAEVEGVDTDPWGNERVGVSLTGAISRSDYGMKFNQALGSGNLLVGDKVKLDLDFSAVKQA